MIILNSDVAIIFGLLALIILIVFSIVNKRNKLRAGIDVVFIAYCTCVVVIILFPLGINLDDSFSLSSVRISWIPYRDVYDFFVLDLSLRGFASVMYNVIGNFLLFVPLSAYLTWTRPLKFKQNLLLALCISGSAEILQLAVSTLGSQMRTIDSTDLILNIGGAWISLLIFRKLLARAASKFKVTQKMSAES
jgi:glycopeptide antibiotics resistance protein